MTAHGRWHLQQRLLAAVRRVTPTKALGYRRPVTYTHAGQSSPNLSGRAAQRRRPGRPGPPGRKPPEPLGLLATVDSQPHRPSATTRPNRSHRPIR
jgi:hypothetical protein